MDAPSPLKPGDAFGEEVTLPERTIIYVQGHSRWDSALDTLVEAFKTLNEYMDKHELKAAGPAMTIYTKTDDTGFAFRAAVPIAEAPKDPPKGDLAIGQAPSGRALKFIHRGSYDAMDSTYEAITNYLDDKGIDAKDSLHRGIYRRAAETRRRRHAGERVCAGEIAVFGRVDLDRPHP